jgi:hypothetical protein
MSDGDGAREVGDDGQRPRLTVLVAAWNAAGTIERALDSVLDEREIPLECIVVDDGSTDGTPELVEAVAARDRRVVLVRLPVNEGVSAARNRGLAVARGDWLTFLDADDRLLPGAIAALMRPTTDPDVRAVIGQRIWTDGERTWISSFYDIPDIREPGRKSIATHPGLLYYASATGRVVHRSLVDDLRFEGRVLGDQPWTIRALLRAGDRVEVIGDDVYEWSRPTLDHPVATITSATRGSAERSAESATVARRAYLEVADEIDARIDDPTVRLATKQAYAERLFRSDFSAALKSAIDHRDPGTARFLDALTGLLAVVPPQIVARSDTLVRAVLRPPWDGFPELTPDARSAYWRLVALARRADPAIGGRIMGRRRLDPAFELVRRTAALDPRLAALMVRAVRPVRSVVRAVRRLRG